MSIIEEKREQGEEVAIGRLLSYSSRNGNTVIKSPLIGVFLQQYPDAPLRFIGRESGKPHISHTTPPEAAASNVIELMEVAKHIFACSDERVDPESRQAAELVRLHIREIAGVILNSATNPQELTTDADRIELNMRNMLVEAIPEIISPQS